MEKERTVLGVVNILKGETVKGIVWKLLELNNERMTQ